MRLFLRFLFIFLFSWLFQSFLPFWSAAIVAFVVGLLLSQKRKRRLYGKSTPPPRAFLAGFFALFFLWGITAFFLDRANHSLLSLDIFTLIFQSPEALPYPSLTMVTISAFIGGLVGGFSSMSGNLLGEAIQE